MWLSLAQEHPGWQLLEQATPACLHGHLFRLWHLVRQLQGVAVLVDLVDKEEQGGG